MSDLGKAIRIASEVFEHHSDKGGNPYMCYIVYVLCKVLNI